MKLTKQLKKELIESKRLFAAQTYEDCLELFHDHEYLPQLMRLAGMLDEGVISDQT